MSIQPKPAGMDEQSQPPLTPVEATRLLWEVDLERMQVTEALKKLRLKLPALNRERRRAFAGSFLRSQGAEQFRRQTAELASLDEKFALDTCEQEIEACQDKLWELKGRSEDLRAINSNLKEELRSLGGMP